MRSAENRLVLLTGLSGAGKNTILHMLEDVGFEAIDNPPFPLLAELAAGTAGRRAIGIDARSQGFDPDAVLALRARLGACPAGGRGPAMLVYATASDPVLLRRFSKTRRLHPLAREGRVADGIAAERVLLAGLAASADMVIDTTDLPLPELRRLVERRIATAEAARLRLSLVSFAFPAGLPAEADMVFDARFLKNPHYDPILQPLTGRDTAVARFIESDPDYEPFAAGVFGLLERVLPRFVTEGKKYATVAVGCTGGQHRSVRLVEDLAARLEAGLRVDGEGEEGIVVTVLHRELGAREAADRS